MCRLQKRGVGLRSANPTYGWLGKDAYAEGVMVKGCEGSYRRAVSDYARLIRPSVSRTDQRRKVDSWPSGPFAVACGFLLVR